MVTEILSNCILKMVTPKHLCDRYFQRNNLTNDEHTCTVFPLLLCPSLQRPPLLSGQISDALE